LLFLYWKIR